MTKTCKNCGGKDLSWFTSNTTRGGIQQNRLNTRDVTCLFVLGCNECSETLEIKRADSVAEGMNAAQPELEALSSRVAELEGALRIVRVKAIPAGGAVVSRNPDWHERVTEVLDVIDTALLCGAPA